MRGGVNFVNDDSFSFRPRDISDLSPPLVTSLIRSSVTCRAYRTHVLRHAGHRGDHRGAAHRRCRARTRGRVLHDMRPEAGVGRAAQGGWKRLVQEGRPRQGHRQVPPRHQDLRDALRGVQGRRGGRAGGERAMLRRRRASLQQPRALPVQAGQVERVRGRLHGQPRPHTDRRQEPSAPRRRPR